LAKYPDTRIQVSGHTDSTGSEQRNLELSVRRAQAVSGYLSSQSVAGSRIESFGYGETSPRESNETAEGRQLNRRVEIRIKAEPV
jgi:outer membrane protein OmpA-like peptidoglycan-associated protein